MTIDELIQGKAPGEIKIRREDWKKGIWFQPYFKADAWYGLQADDSFDSWDDIGDCWHLYTEPKPKVTRWLWMNKEHGGVVCSTEKDFARPNMWTKIPGTEVEMEEF